MCPGSKLVAMKPSGRTQARRTTDCGCNKAELAKPIGLLGAGGQSLEIRGYLRRNVEFCAVDLEYLSGQAAGPELIQIDRPRRKHRETEVICALGAPGLKRKAVESWPGDQYASVVAEGAFVSSLQVTIGAGSVVAPQSVVMAGCTVGDHVLINTGSIISHEVTVGSYTTISPGASVGGRVNIGRGVFVGIGAILRDGVTIGDGAVIGAGTLVLRDVAELDVVAGVPAKVLRRGTDWLDQV